MAWGRGQNTLPPFNRNRVYDYNMNAKCRVFIDCSSNFTMVGISATSLYCTCTAHINLVTAASNIYITAASNIIYNMYNSKIWSRFSWFDVNCPNPPRVATGRVGPRPTRTIHGTADGARGTSCGATSRPSAITGPLHINNVKFVFRVNDSSLVLEIRI